MKTILYTLMLVACSITFANADSGVNSVFGNVLDNEKHEMHGVVIVLKSLPDSAFVSGVQTGIDGGFKIEKIPDGSYFLEIKYIGYKSLLINPITLNPQNTKYFVGKVELVQESKELSVVTISAETPLVEMAEGKTIVNVDKNSVFMNNNLLEILEKSPAVTVNKDGNILFNGKQDVLVLIDGKPTYLRGQDLQNVLKSYQANSIQKIEFSTTASAKYDAAGNGGIINVITKKNHRQGITGSVNASYGQGVYSKNNESFNIGFRNKKISTLFNYSFSARKSYNKLNAIRDIDQDSLGLMRINTKTDNLFLVFTHTPRLTFEYNITPKTKWSLICAAISNVFKPTLVSDALTYDETSYLLQKQMLDSKSLDKFGNYTISNEVIHMLDTNGRQVTFDFDFANYFNNSIQDLSLTSKSNSDSLIGVATLHGDQKGSTQVYAMKVDYTIPLKSFQTIESGIKSSIVKAGNNNKFYTVDNNQMILDDNRTNLFLYSENINAAYFNYIKNTEKYSISTGIRVENTNIYGIQKTTNEQFTTSYTQVFPNFSWSKNINEKNKILISAGRRIDRPDYRSLNPFRFNVDALSYDRGNPKLKPQLTNNLEVSYSFKNSFLISGGYSLTSNKISEVITNDGLGKNTTIQTHDNVGDYHYAYTNISYTQKIAKIIRSTNNLIIYNGIMKPYDENMGKVRNLICYTISSTNNISLKNNYSIDVVSKYNSNYLDGLISMRSIFVFNVGIQKTLPKNKGNISLNCSDVFKTSILAGVTESLNVREDWAHYRDSRVVTLSFTYKFGNDKPLRLRRSTAAESELQRAG